ncbi:hypothetical protein BG000_010999 [Podila horticola]|nr:hypothetical protein BG000_010999 [Podila horticola]
MMVPDPMCPNCHSEFVEEIDPENDPRTFVDSAPLDLTGNAARGDRSLRGHEPVNLEDLFRLFQAAFATPQRTAIHHRAPGQILLNQFGIEVHYTTDPSAMGGFGGMGGGFNMAGNPGDYVFGQHGIDDIISQMMELQNRQHGPVGAAEEIINDIPKHTLTDAELEDKLDCSVCKDDFTKADNLLQLPCKHIFHEDCIKPWLKVSGTCPTWR